MTESLEELKRQAEKAEFVYETVIGCLCLSFFIGFPTFLFFMGAGWVIFPVWFGACLILGTIIVTSTFKDETEKDYREALRHE